MPFLQVSARRVSSMLLTLAIALSVSAQPNPIQRGSLFVLNVQPNAAEVLLTDPIQGDVLRRFPAGRDADMAISPSGHRVYIISSLRPTDPYDTLEVFDTASGAKLQSAILFDRAKYKIFPAMPVLLVSADDRWAYVLTMRWVQRSRQQDEYFIAIFDTEKGVFLDEQVPLGECGSSVLYPRVSGNGIHVACSGSHVVYSVTFGSSGRYAEIQRSETPRVAYNPGAQRSGDHETPAHPYFAAVFPGPSGNPTFITGDGRSLRREQAGRWDARRVTSEHWVSFTGSALSSDGSSVYVPAGPLSTRYTKAWTNEILVLDTRSLSVRRSIQTRELFWGLTLTKNGTIYVFNPKSGLIAEIDPATGRELRRLPPVALAPARIIEAP